MPNSRLQLSQISKNSTERKSSKDSQRSNTTNIEDDNPSENSKRSNETVSMKVTAKKPAKGKSYFTKEANRITLKNESNKSRNTEVTDENEVFYEHLVGDKIHNAGIDNLHNTSASGIEETSLITGDKFFRPKTRNYSRGNKLLDKTNIENSPLFKTSAKKLHVNKQHNTGTKETLNVGNRIRNRFEKSKVEFKPTTYEKSPDRASILFDNLIKNVQVESSPVKTYTFSSPLTVDEVSSDRYMPSDIVNTKPQSISDNGNILKDTFDNANVTNDTFNYEKLVNDPKIASTPIKLTSLKRPALHLSTDSSKKTKTEDMLNGFRMADTHNNHSGKLDDILMPAASNPIATLSNIGNTCYLNSVVYTLRFTPFFLHNLHHLVDELVQVHQKLSQTKAKSSSLGRNMVGLSGTNSRSWSSKDLPALGLQSDATPKTPIQIVTEKLHELYRSLRMEEMKDHSAPYQTDAFLKSVQEVNKTFEGNQQQDAHELLMCVFDVIRETCKFLSSQNHIQAELNGFTSVKEISLEEIPLNNTSKSFFSRKSLMKRTGKSTKGSTTLDNSVTNMTNGKTVIEEEMVQPSRELGYDFIVQDFQGTTVSRTTCLTCEQVTECRETMFDIPVPIVEQSTSDEYESSSLLYQNACVTSEYLRDQNKYYCESCRRYCEARRSISYEMLPRLLILQMKRFSGGMEKISDYMPTPLRLACFCNSCIDLQIEKRLHHYKLYGVIMHVGATMSVGHYIAYTRALDLKSDYVECERVRQLNSKASTIEKTTNTGLKKIFSRSKSSNNTDKVSNGGGVSIVNSCQGVTCCSIKFRRTVSDDYVIDGDDGYDERHTWYVCDDERVRQISSEEFESLIDCKSGVKQMSTPYLLFYVKYDSK